MSEPGFASLGPTLLARKGGAKPAMRPQVAPLVADEAEIAALADEQLEDLGWNDMGDGDSETISDNGADVVPINAAVAAADPDASQSPIVRRQQRRLEERVLADAVMTGPADAAAAAFDEFDEDEAEADEGKADYEDETEERAGPAPDFAPQESDAPVFPAVRAPAAIAAPVPRPAPRGSLRSTERRAAFTLRLDPERHLKLRLAATMQGVSAQALLTEALDAMLAEFDDLDVIAAHLKRH